MSDLDEIFGHERPSSIPESERVACQHEGCTSMDGLQCNLVNYGEDTEEKFTYYYCSSHAQQNGFCWACGDFWGGVSSFEGGDGLCENCAVEFDCDYDDEYFPGEDEWEEDEADEFWEDQNEGYPIYDDE